MSEHPLELVEREFAPVGPNRFWVSDLKYGAIWRGFVYVAFVIDAFARRIVGCRVSTSHLMRWSKPSSTGMKPAKNDWFITVIGGVKYLYIKYSERLAEAGIEPSVGSTGDSYDNALAECAIVLYNSDVIRN